MSRNLESVLDVKKSLSYRTKWPIEQIYFINKKGNEAPKDEDRYLYDYDIVFVLNTDNIDVRDDLLGRGSFGEVRLCRDKLSNEQFALKIPLNKEKDLSREIIILHRLKYSSTLFGYRDLYSFKGSTCVAMKYLPGDPLNSYLEKNKVTEQQIAKWCHQILKQINELHKKDIIHRDIRSDNIVLDKQNNVNLIDFGIAKLTNDVLSENVLKNFRMSRTGSEVHMAPEMINGEKCSNKIDIWSFGVTVIEMVLRERPYKNLLPIQALVRIGNLKKIEYEPPEPISEELKSFIDLCLNPNVYVRCSAKQLMKSEFISNNLNKIR